MKHFQNQVLEKYDNVTDIPSTTTPFSHSTETSFSTTFETSNAAETTSITTSRSLRQSKTKIPILVKKLAKRPLSKVNKT